MHTIPSIGGRDNQALKGIGERILQNATVYLMDGAIDDDQLSDKHKISLFDDSRFEDFGTLDNSSYAQGKVAKGKKQEVAARDKYYNNNSTIDPKGLLGPRGNGYSQKDSKPKILGDHLLEDEDELDQGEDELLN